MARLDNRVAAAVLLVAALATRISLQNLAQAGRDEGKKEEAGKAIDTKYADKEESEKKSGEEIGAADAVGSNHEEKSDSEVSGQDNEHFHEASEGMCDEFSLEKNTTSLSYKFDCDPIEPSVKTRFEAMLALESETRMSESKQKLLTALRTERICELDNKMKGGVGYGWNFLQEDKKILAGAQKAWDVARKAMSAASHESATINEARNYNACRRDGVRHSYRMAKHLEHKSDDEIDDLYDKALEVEVEKEDESLRQMKALEEACAKAAKSLESGFEEKRKAAKQAAAVEKEEAAALKTKMEAEAQAAKQAAAVEKEQAAALKTKMEAEARLKSETKCQGLEGTYTPRNTDVKFRSYVIDNGHNIEVRKGGSSRSKAKELTACIFDNEKKEFCRGVETKYRSGLLKREKMTVYICTNGEEIRISESRSGETVFTNELFAVL